MPLWKRIFRGAYYRGTLPLRWWNSCVALADDRVPVIVLCYHRVADDEATPWTVSNETFFRQILWIKERFEIVSLEEAQCRVHRGANHQPCVSITFDDGYADNCQQAIPFLVKEQIPCTYFVTLENVLFAQPFTHDLLLGHSIEPNNLEQLRALAAAGVEIGAHAYTHLDLSTIADPRLLRFEVAEAGAKLEYELDQKVRYFSFPMANEKNITAAMLDEAHRAGYEAVCSAAGGFNIPGGDSFLLQRIVVHNDIIDLKNWVTGDPRKRRAFEPVVQVPQGEPLADDQPVEAVGQTN